MFDAHPSDRPLPPGHLEQYLSEIRADALLTADEERALALDIARGDRDARTRMIRANLRLVIKIARDYLGRGLALDDLVGEGNLGLIRAAEEFDPSFGTRFSTYASHWIKQAIRHALTNTTATIRVPSHMVNLLTRWRRAERDLRRDLGTEPSFGQVADHLGLTDAQRLMVERAQRAGRLCRDASPDADDRSWSLQEAPDPSDEPSATLEADEQRRDLLRRLDRLDDRERTIVALRFGLDGDAPLTLKEVGRRLGVTREWVRKIEMRAVRKLDDQPDSPRPPGPGPLRSIHPRRAHASRPRVPRVHDVTCCA